MVERADELIERDCKLGYFLITQDHRIPNYIEYVDFIERLVPLVSDELKQLLKQFEKTAGFIPVVLVDLKRGIRFVIVSVETEVFLWVFLEN
jgi:hypothetical protein